MNRLRDSDVIFPAPNDERTQNQPAQGDQKFQNPAPPDITAKQMTTTLRRGN